ncbi:MAG: hypothetical protein J6Q58_04170 [Clostridia bacterium]|nr:hypothetical protein [Clostridia bacterium]
MALYLGTIIFNTILIIILNYIFYSPINTQFSMFEFVIIVVLGVILEIIIDIIFATVVRWILPEKFFSIDKLYFSASKKEARFYEKIGIKRWKDKALELGAVTGFRKNKLYNPQDNEYVKRFILEANYGIMVHVFCIVFGFLIMLANAFAPLFWVTLPIAIVNLFLNLLPIFILRYNLPKLHSLYKFNMRKSKISQI